MKDVRKMMVSLVLRLEDFASGRILTPDDIQVSSEDGFNLPLFKKDGYFVFTGKWPKKVAILSDHYENLVFYPVQEATEIYRLALIPTPVRQPFFNLPLPHTGMIFVGLNGLRTGYTPAENIVDKAQEIALQKNDLNDITSAWHLLLGRDGADTEPVFVTQNLGYNKYRLLTPVQKAYAARGCRLIQLRRLISTQNDVVRIPVVLGDSAIYVMESEGGTVKRIEAEDL